MDGLVPDVDWGRVALSCHFALDLLCDEVSTSSAGLTERAREDMR